MKKIKLFLAAALGLLAVGCYNDFDTPAPAKVWTEAEVQALGLTPVSIKELKGQFIKAFGSLEHTGDNGSWADTKTLKCGPAANPVEAEFATDPGNMKFWDEAENYYIKGKVISSDAQGNVYKSLYIDDGTGAIELKLCGTLYTIYKLDLTRMDTQWVYVKLNGLYLGNYRMMLSLGDAPSNALNTGGANKFYANSNFETPLLWRNTSIAQYNRVLPGGPAELVEASIDVVVSDTTPDEEKPNIIAVNSSNYDKLGQDYYSRLIRFEDVTIRYAGVTYQNPVAYDEEGNVTEWSEDIVAPAIGDDYFPNYIVTDTGVPEWYHWYRWAYSNVDQGVSLYGSVLMLLNDSATDTNQAGVYSIRTSGYSRFAMKPIPADGTVGTVLGIYSIYSKTLYYAQYQITVNRIEDLDFPEESLLSEAWIAHNTPEESYAPVVKNGAGEYDD